MDKYGLIFLFVVVFLEYMNVPGLPGAVVFMVAGVWLASSGQSFILALAVSVLAGLCAGVILYLIGKKGGQPLLGKYLARHPKILPRAEAFTTSLRRHAGKTIFLAKLTPVIRTLVALLAGISGVRLGKYLFFATFGITLWNGVLMLVGLYFSELVLERFA